MDKKKQFKTNDFSIAMFLKKNGSKMVSKKNGVFVFEYDGTIDKNMELYEDVLKKSMF